MGDFWWYKKEKRKLIIKDSPNGQLAVVGESGF